MKQHMKWKSYKRDKICHVVKHIYSFKFEIISNWKRRKPQRDMCIRLHDWPPGSAGSMSLACLLRWSSWSAERSRTRDTVNNNHWTCAITHTHNFHKTRDKYPANQGVDQRPWESPAQLQENLDWLAGKRKLAVISDLLPKGAPQIDLGRTQKMELSNLSPMIIQEMEEFC